MSVKPLRAALAAAAFALSLGSSASAQAPTLSTDPASRPRACMSSTRPMPA